MTIIWYFCPKCNEIKEAEFKWRADKTYFYACKTCGEECVKANISIVEIVRPTDGEAPDEKAKARCMSICVMGTRSCNCHCGGRCHGQKRCFC